MTGPLRAWRGWRRWLLVGALLTGLQSAPAQEAPPACPPVAELPSAAELQSARATARDRGFLWRLTRDGRSSWLFGTVHVGRLDWAFPGPALRAALVAVDTLALELDTTDPQTAAEIAAGLAAGPVLDPLPPDIALRLERQIAAACLPPEALDGQHPVMRAVALTLLASRWDGLDTAWGQEPMLARIARARGMPIVALETAATQAAALVPADRQQALDTLVATLDALERGSVRASAERLARAWAEQRLDELAGYEDWCNCVADARDRDALRRLNDDRNAALARGIEALHAQGRRVLAAVGALHMTGPLALPRLLAQRGFAVVPVGFTP